MKVAIKREALEMLLEAAKSVHPREALFLLRGRLEKDEVTVEELVIPPLATYGYGFAGFPSHTIPLDARLIGSAHSHPSGSLEPSVEDLNASFGPIILVLAYPYTPNAVAAYDPWGRQLELEIT